MRQSADPRFGLPSLSMEPASTTSGPAAAVSNAAFTGANDGIAFGFITDEQAPTPSSPDERRVGDTPTGVAADAGPDRRGTAGTSAARKKQKRPMATRKHSTPNDHGKLTEGHHAAHQVPGLRGEREERRKGREKGRSEKRKETPHATARIHCPRAPTPTRSVLGCT